MLTKFTNVEDCCCRYSGTAIVSVTPGGDVDVQAVTIDKACCKVAKIPAFKMVPDTEEHWRQLERYVANELEYRDSFCEEAKVQWLSERHAEIA